MAGRTITQPANNSGLISSVIRDQLQILEDEITDIQPASPTNAIQYNAGGGSFGGSATFTFDGTNQVTLGTEADTGSIIAPTTTTANTDGGSLALFAADGTGTGIGGSVSLQAADGGLTSGNGGDVQLQAGNAQAGNSNGGSLIFIQGTKAGAGTSGKVYFQDGTSGLNAILNTGNIASSDKTFTFPNTSGTLALTSDITAGANTALSNLASVAINTTLVSDTDNTDDLGTSSIFWKTGYFKTSIELGATDTTLTRSSAGVIAVEGVVVDTISAANTLTNKTLTSPTIQTTPVLAAGTNVILTVPTVDDTATGEITNAFNSGYSSSAIGDLVILDSSATWQKTDANTASLYNGLIGIALEVKASGNALKVLLRGFAYCSTAFPTFTVGGTVYMSETAGAVTQTAPTTTDSATRILGYAVHADKMWFNPSPDWITHT